MRISRRALTMFGVCVGLFLAALDVSIVATALPVMVADLGGLSAYSWVVSAYMLASTAGGPVFGKLSDLYGRKRLFLIGIGIFLAGSMLCGQARSMEQLIVFRFVQGIGGGAILALSITIAGALFQAVERARMMAIVSSVWGISALVGPLTGGLIVDGLSWPWVFYVNLPVGAVATLIVVLSLRETATGRRPRIDYAGIAVFIVSVVALLLAVLQGGQSWPWLSAPSLGLFAIAAIGTACFFWIERRVPEPLLPLPLFRLRTVTVGTAGSFLTGAVLLSAGAYIPLFIQGVLGRSATEAGAVLTPMSLGWPAGGLIGGQILNRIGYRRMAIAGGSFISLGFFLLTLVSEATTPAQIVVYMFLVGLGMGLISPTFLTAVQNTIPAAQLGIATSTVQFARTIGGVLGVGVLGALMAARLTAGLDRLAAVPAAGGLPADLAAAVRDPQALLDPAFRAQLPEEILIVLRQALAGGLQATYVASFTLGLLILVLAFQMPNRRPGEPESPKARDQTPESVATRREGLP
ncbi:MAG TPA: MDR family MFS transporter [Dehalococcoidia bacterium]|nr:MDR family MFS transporter [Dehalococcoidia bacterium]